MFLFSHKHQGVKIKIHLRPQAGKRYEQDVIGTTVEAFENSKIFSFHKRATVLIIEIWHVEMVVT